MKKKIMLVMPLSALEGTQRCKGGVDSVCQLLLKVISRIDTKNEYLALAFNPADDTKKNGECTQLSRNIKIKTYNVHLNRQSKIKRLIPNFIWQNLIIKNEVSWFYPDVLHVHSPGWLLFNYKNVKKILTLHSYKKIARSSFGFWNDFVYEKMVHPINIRNADVITTVSKDIKKILANKGHQKVRYIANPINDIFFQLDRKTIKTENELSIIIPGIIVARKRDFDGLKIVLELQQEYPNVKLFFAGKYDQNSRYYLTLKEYIKSHKLEKNVNFMGSLSITDLLKCYSKITIGIFLSENETFGLAPLEMMAAGIPVITTNVGVFKWYEKDFKKRGVYLVTSGDVTKVTNIIRGLLRNPANIVNEKLRQFIMERFSVEKITKEYLSLF